MSPRRRPGRKTLKALLPIVLLPLAAFLGYAVWVVYGAAYPPQQDYLLTPEKLAPISERASKVAEENWQNRDGTQARGWLLRGSEGAPAIIMLHRYGADRSWLLNLGVRLNDPWNYTVLWPDLRGHGKDPPVQTTSFGPREADDLLAAIEHLRSLKTPQGNPLVGDRFGVYGVGLGAYAGLRAAPEEVKLQALVLDSVPMSADEVVYGVLRERGMDTSLHRLLARVGARVYFLGGFNNNSACTVAETLGDRRVLLLTGEGAGPLRASTEVLAKCFPNPPNVELRSDLPLTGISLESATGQLSDSYSQLVIEFFSRTLAP
jgi:pimeloyl-ACP methyl ester carboxylesterase